MIVLFSKKLLFQIVVLLLICGAAATAGADEIFSKNKKANKLYENGKYEEALKLYEDALLLDPSANSLKMNKGSALYKLENYEEAEKLYKDALTQENKDILADAHYNLGNILFKNGEQLESAGDPSANEKYQQALENYIRTLELRPDDKDAKWNLQLAHQKVQMMQNQQNQSGNDEKDDKNKEKDKSKEEQSDQQENEQNEKQQNKNEQQKESEQKDQNKEEQNQQKQSAEEQKQKESDLKKEDAARLLELYADDADTLNKPKRKLPARFRQPEKDW